MKIAILVPTFSAFSGVDRVAEQQAREFAQRGDDVSIFALRASLAPPLGVELHILGMPRSSLGERVYRLLFPLDFVKAVTWVPRLRVFDVIYSHQYPMNWLAYLAKRFYGVKYICYNHGIAPPEIFPSLVERAYMRMFSPLANWTIRRADGAISVSRYLQQELERETGVDSEVVYNKIDLQRFHPGVDSSMIRGRYNLGHAPLILYVGRVSPHKGVHLLLETFALVRREVPDARLMIVGKHTFSGYSKKLRELSDSSVIFAGEVSDEELPYYYAACDLYATCTQWEGFDLPLAEARACGKPVVAFDIGPHSEVVGGEDGVLLLPPKDLVGLAQAITTTLSDSRGVGSIL